MEKPPKFVPYEKRSKKSQKEFNEKSRADWGGVRLASQTFTDKTEYDRSKNRTLIDEELIELDDDKDTYKEVE